MRSGIMIFIAGVVLTVFGLAMFIPAVVDSCHNAASAEAFFLAAGITIFFGLSGAVSSYNYWRSISVKETFFTTSFVWLVVVIFSALPFYIWHNQISYAAAFFEAMSGLTSTGATNFTDLDNMPKGILLWRAMLQWIGGIGIIMIAIAVLPILRTGGMQLFLSESSDKFGDKASPRLIRVIKIIFLIYLFLTIACAFALYFGGMGSFDAIAHALTCVSTGGFSTHDKSIAFFASSLIDWIVVVFMILGALPFLSYYFLVTGKVQKFTSDTQIKSYLLIILFISLLLAFWIWLEGIVPDFTTAVRSSTFNLVSVITTTGYASANYNVWGAFAVMLFFFVAFVGGCSGSSSGGIKIFRINVMFLNVVRHLKQMVSPHGVFVLKYNQRTVSGDVLDGIVVFITILLIMTVAASLALSAMGIDFMTALSGVIASLTNVGPGLGNIIGPAGSYAELPDTAKWILSFCMMFGRLEFTTVTVLLLPLMWKDS